MRKKIVSVVIVFFTCCVVCAGSISKGRYDGENELLTEEGASIAVADEPANMEAVLKEAAKQGYAARKANQRRIGRV